jgi:hypothetical protein
MTKKKIKTVKGLVKKLRTIRDNLNVELSQMNSKERMLFFKSLQLKSNRSEA